MPSLSVDAWCSVLKHCDSQDFSSLLETCTESRDAVLECVSVDQEGKRILNEKQAWAYAMTVHLGQNLFITGGAGVGKTYTTRVIIESMCDMYGDERIALAAPTAIAAMIASTDRVRGMTVHMMFNIRNRCRPSGSSGVHTCEDMESAIEVAERMEDEDEESGIPTAVLGESTLMRLLELQLLVIDEISMLSCEFLQLIHDALCYARQNSRPFGGCAVLFCGDFYQLPPVIKGDCLIRNAGRKWAFQSELWGHVKPIELTACIRQHDVQFSNVLNRIRTNKMTLNDVSWMNHAAAKSTRVSAMGLFWLNKHATARNIASLKALPGTAVAYKCRSGATLQSETSTCSKLVSISSLSSYKLKFVSENRCPTELVFKLNARVRCTRNLYVGDWDARTIAVCNGQKGTILRMEENVILVRWDAVGTVFKEQDIPIERTEYKKKQTFRLKKQVVYCIRTQFPLALSYASTIHNSQGSGIHTDVDINTWSEYDGTAIAGLAYVSLSRACSVEKMHLVQRLHTSHIHADQDVVKYYLDF